MNSNNVKNIIVLKNLPSNLIDEAFIILKDNKKAKALKKIENNSENNTKKEKTGEYIVKEAEMIISNYLSKLEKEKQIKSNSIKKIENKYNRLKFISMLLGVAVILNIILWIKKLESSKPLIIRIHFRKGNLITRGV